VLFQELQEWFVLWFSGKYNYLDYFNILKIKNIILMNFFKKIAS